MKIGNYEFIIRRIKQIPCFFPTKNSLINFIKKYVNPKITEKIILTGEINEIYEYIIPSKELKRKKKK